MQNNEYTKFFTKQFIGPKCYLCQVEFFRYRDIEVPGAIMRYMEHCKRSLNSRMLILFSLLVNTIFVIVYLMNQKILPESMSSVKIATVRTGSRVKVFNKTYLRLDARNDPNSSVIYKHISMEIPYLPIDDLNNIKYKNRNFNETCAWYPTFLDIQIHNDYWQEFHNHNITYFIFGAYFDNRPTATYNESLVRVLTMMNLIAKTAAEYPSTYCQIWYKEQSQPVINLVKDLRRIWHYAWGHGKQHNYAHLLDCPVSREHKNWIPQTVSLVASPCDKATNNVKVTYEPIEENEEKKGFAVCVKGLDFPYVDMSHRLVEYIETMRSLGAEKITMYQLQVHPNTTKVLNYYEETGYLEYRPFSLSLEVGNLKEYRHLEMAKNSFSYILHEVIPYNDCLYRNMYRYKYIAVVDVDEIPMPVGNHTTWQDLIDFAESHYKPNCPHYASYCFRCIYFPKYPEKQVYNQDIPEYFYMMQHVYRVREHIRPDWYTKCLHNTDSVITMHNHFPIHWIREVCPHYSFEATEAQLQHYREPREANTLSDPVIDKNIWRLKDGVIERSMKVFEELNFFDEIIHDDIKK